MCIALLLLFQRTACSKVHFSLRLVRAGGLTSTAAARLTFRLGTVGRGQKLLPAVVAAEVVHLSTALGVERGGFVHGHAADGVDGFGFGWFRGHISF